MADFLDEELVDVGIVGGELWLRCDSGAWFVDLDYWSPDPLGERQLEMLLEDARGQLSDGAGADIVIPELERANLVLVFDERNARLETLEDGRSVPKPNELALHAKKGQIENLVEALGRAAPGALEQKLGPFTPLQWACLNGHSLVALALVDAGSSLVHGSTSDPRSTPLELCVFSRGCADEDACRIVDALLARGVSGDFAALAEQAEGREKYSLARLLRQQKQA